MVSKEYKTWYEQVGKLIHWESYQRLKFNHEDKWYMHKPVSALE